MRQVNFVVLPAQVQLHLASALMPITGLENATKWEPGSVKGVELDGAYVIASQLNHIDKQQGDTHTDSLQMELQRAQDRVGKLEAERVSAKKQRFHCLRNGFYSSTVWLGFPGICQPLG
jgi:hypothetical protein